MKLRKQRMSRGRAAVAAVALLAACSMMEPIKPTAWWISYGASSYCVEDGKVKITTPAGVRGEVTFKDANNEPMGRPTHVEGGATVELPVPEGAAAFDWTGGGVPDESISYDGETPAGLPLAGSPSAATAMPAHRPMPSVFSMGCMTATFDHTETSYGYLLRALSKDSADAFAQMEAVLQGKVGTPVPSSVLVDAFVEIAIEGNHVKVVSSLHDQFASYVATLNGFVVADLGLGLNAAVSHGANGWDSVTSYMPLELIQEGQTLYLHQQGLGAAEPVYMAIQ